MDKPRPAERCFRGGRGAKSTAGMDDERGGCRGRKDRGEGQKFAAQLERLGEQLGHSQDNCNGGDFAMELAQRSRCRRPTAASWFPYIDFPARLQLDGNEATSSEREGNRCPVVALAHGCACLHGYPPAKCSRSCHACAKERASVSRLVSAPSRDQTLYRGGFESSCSSVTKGRGARVLAGLAGDSRGTRDRKMEKSQPLVGTVPLRFLIRFPNQRGRRCVFLERTARRNFQIYLRGVLASSPTQ